MVRTRLRARLQNDEDNANLFIAECGFCSHSSLDANNAVLSIDAKSFSEPSKAKTPNAPFM